MFDTDVLSDLIESKNWRSILIASWLCCLSPKIEFSKYLKMDLTNVLSQCSQLVNVAIFLCENNHRQESTPLKDAILQFRELLSLNHWKHESIRKLTPAEQSLFENENEHLQNFRNSLKVNDIHHAVQELNTSPLFSLIIEKR